MVSRSKLNKEQYKGLKAENPQISLHEKTRLL